MQAAALCGLLNSNQQDKTRPSTLLPGLQSFSISQWHLPTQTISTLPFCCPSCWSDVALCATPLFCKEKDSECHESCSCGVESLVFSLGHSVGNLSPQHQVRERHGPGEKDAYLPQASLFLSILWCCLEAWALRFACGDLVIVRLIKVDRLVGITKMKPLPELSNWYTQTEELNLAAIHHL